MKQMLTASKEVKPTVAGQLTPGQSAPEMESMSNETNTVAVGFDVMTRSSAAAALEVPASVRAFEAGKPLRAGIRRAGDAQRETHDPTSGLRGGGIRAVV